MPRNYFLLSVTSLCTMYLLFEFFFNSYAIFSVDEFWFAHSIYQYKDHLPYRDFPPYKTILGYYLLLPPMLSARGVMQTLIFTKNAFTLLNTLILFTTGFWLTRFFSRIGVISSLAIIVSAEIVLSYSTQLRVDLLSYWFCFFSLLFLLEKRYLVAGILIGLGFATSQKAIWYMFASNCALGVHWLQDRRVKHIWSIARFNSICVGIIVIYLVFWSWVSDWSTVFKSVFLEAAAMYQLDWYESARTLFWQNILLNNPLLFLLWPITFLNVLITYDEDAGYQSRLFVTIYASVILLCLVPYKQIFPYYTQVTIPVFFVLYAAFFSWLFEVFKENRTRRLIIPEKIFWVMLFLYELALLVVIMTLDLPEFYVLISFIPVSLIFYATQKHDIQKKIASPLLQLTIVTIISIDLIYPFILLPTKLIDINGAYQRTQIEVVNTLLQDGSDYVAGIDFIYNKTQPIPGLRHLRGPAIDYLYNPTRKLRSIILPSLCEDPTATVDSVITALAHSSVKIYVNNYRINALPKKIKNYLHSQYEHWWGSIYLYAPHIDAKAQNIVLKFSGNYLIESASNDFITLNDKRYFPGAIVSLQKGNIKSNAAHAYRLKLIPANIPFVLDSSHKNDDWVKVIF